MSYLRSNRDFEEENLRRFETELGVLGVGRPRLIAFGRDAFEVLHRNLGDSYDILGVPHYSNFISKERYKERIATIIQEKTKRS